jgi:AAA domain/Bifunctional DNA primase/polymerase, N-terminal
MNSQTNPAEKANPADAAPGPLPRSAGIAFIVTNVMKAKLAALGWTPEDIADMTPVKVNDLIDSGTVKSVPSSESKPASSPFGLAGARLLDMGYHPIPIVDKRPGHRGHGLPEWERYEHEQPSQAKIDEWSHPKARNGIGIVLGGQHCLKGADIDTDNAEITAAILSVLPPCTVVKMGSKGSTRMYRGSALPPEKKQWWDADGVLVFELLGSGQQTVVPPSIHPRGMAYQWLMDGTLENTAPSDLPELPADTIERLDAVLAPLGCTRSKPSKKDEQPAPAVTPREPGDNPWRDLNDQALANLDKWVPALDLYKWRRKSNGGFEAVASWRPSNTPARPLAQRDRNLKIDPKGIVDFGDVKYTPINLVMAATGCDRDAAARWLDERLGFIAPVSDSQRGNVVDLHGNSIRPEPRKIIRATPFKWMDPKTISPREWLYARHLVRKYLSTTIAQGGGGKTSLIYAEALAMVTGRDLLKIGETIEQGLRAWIWNGEDPYDEIQRRIMAICKHYGMTAEDIDGKLFADSGRDTELKIAVHEKNGTRIIRPVVDEVIEQMLEREIDLLVIDPAVSFHSVPENDNTAMDMFAKEWGRIADKTNAAIELAQHVRKGHGGQEHTVEDGRGATAINNAARNARVLNFMSFDEAARYGIDDRDRLDYFKVESGKPNMAKRSTGWARWYKMESVSLGNATAKYDSDDVGVVTSFTPTAAADTVPVEQLKEIAKLLNAGRHGFNMQAKDWAGKVVANVLGSDPVKDKKKINGMIKAWVQEGSLETYTDHDKRQGSDREFVKGGIVVDLKPKAAPRKPKAS